MSVKSVYNFVPAPKESEVFKPDWANKVSHDIPFEDGESGEIEIKITAKTPIFIRNGHSKQDAENNTERYRDFSNVIRNGQKEYFIPGSSLKGMFRNVLEIVSKSRMARIDNKRHAVRQIMRTDGVVVDEGYELADENIKSNIKAGWLIYENGKYHIYNCGRPMKIRNTDLDGITDNAFTYHFSKNGKAKISDNFLARTARYKYENIISDDNLVHKFEMHPLDENDKQSSWVSQFQKLNYVRISEDSNQDSFYGHIVCAGQAAEYDVSTARKGEYVFKGRKEDVIASSRNRINISKAKFEDFLFLNRNGKSDELEDWGYWKSEIERGIPVFFRTETKDEQTVLDFGLTFMYKQFAWNTVKDMQPKYLTTNDEKFRMDLADVIFGSIDTKESLKGRLVFSSCKLEGQPRFSGERSVVLSTPRSSYFPFYIKQNGRNGKLSRYNTYNTGGELRGFKRYPIRNGVGYYIQNLDKVSEDMKTKMNPLDSNSVFNGKIRFHNLRKSEIGALLSSITFHGTQGLYHSIGFGKPLGYGKCTVDIRLNNLNFSLTDYIKEFELLMLHKDGNWDINELLSMANENSNLTIDQEYPELDEFQPMKDKGDYLRPNSELSRNKSYLDKMNSHDDLQSFNDSIIEQKRIENEQKEKELRRNQLKKEKEEIEKLQPYNDAIVNADKLFDNGEFAKAKEIYLESCNMYGADDYPKKQKNKCETELAKGRLTLETLAETNVFDSDSRRIIQDFFNAKKDGVSDDDYLKLKEFLFSCIDNLSGTQNWHNEITNK
ncbi:MAG: CRISPR-associated RAMP family protein [Bacteroidetes bacterium 4572_77]|nr:MAG: CRISPR-associated RAMP family protein [Bacteroidetes bacterium 4572_77]